VIRWKLAVVMADRNISNKELAARVGMHPTSVSKIKTRRRLQELMKQLLMLCAKH
jgi:Helix-turn-helix.